MCGLTRRDRRVCRASNALVTVTQGLLDGLAELHGPLAPAHVIPDGTRVAERLPPSRVPSLEEPFQIYYVGQLYPWKGVDVLIEPMQFLPRAELVVKSCECCRLYIWLTEALPATGLRPPRTTAALSPASSIPPRLNRVASSHSR